MIFAGLTSYYRHKLLQPGTRESFLVFLLQGSTLSKCGLKGEGVQGLPLVDFSADGAGATLSSFLVGRRVGGQEV